MNVKAMTILNCIGNYPPDFKVDYSPYRNCYAHALNCMYEDRELSVYSPGLITAVFNDSDCFFSSDTKTFFDADLYIKLIKRDCLSLGINAISCNYDSILHENAYRIALTYSRTGNDFHFLRQNSDGSWSHKPGFGSKRNLIPSRIISYHGESHVEISGDSYRVIEIFQLQKRN